MLSSGSNALWLKSKNQHKLETKKGLNTRINPIKKYKPEIIDPLIKRGITHINTITYVSHHFFLNLHYSKKALNSKLIKSDHTNK